MKVTKAFILVLLVAVLTSCTPAPTPAPTVAPTATAIAVTAEPPAPWWRTARFYEIFVRSFYDTNGDGIGDFNGVTAKLDYLSSLGINAIWLMPINPSPSYHGYDVTNYYSVNPQYGTMDDFKRLLAETHKRGMHVILDLVLNHTSNQHPFFVDAAKGPSSPYYNYYIWSDTNEGQYWHQLPGDPARYYFGLFCDCMPDLNYHNPSVTAEMEKVTAFWLNDVGADGFRLDAVNRLIEEGAKTADTPSTHEWLKGFYQFYKAQKPDAFTVGEVYAADASLVKTYEGNQVDQAFNFEMASDFLGSANSATSAAANSGLTFAFQTLPDGNYATFLTNHDQNRVMSVLSGDVNKAKLAAFMLLTAPGTPFIYYGEEIGMQGMKPDEDIRLPMQWDASANGGFTTGTPWRAPAADFSTVNVAAEEGDPNSLWSTYQRLLAVRSQHTALSTGQAALANTGNPAVYALLRMDAKDTLLVLANLQNQPVTDYSLSFADAQHRLPAGTFGVMPLLGSGTFSDITVGANGEINHYLPLAALPPFGMYILKIKIP